MRTSCVGKLALKGIYVKLVGQVRALGNLPGLLAGVACWGSLPSWLALLVGGAFRVGWRAPRSGYVLQKISENTRGLLWLVVLAFVATRLSAIFSAPTRSPVACGYCWRAARYRKPVVRRLVTLL